MPTLEDAIALAVDAHRGQSDKSGQPYILHPLRVMFRCTTDAQRIVAILHDVVEDTSRTFDDLRKLGYPEDILAALDCVTKREGESYEAFVERAAANPIARAVKIADIEDNLDLAACPASPRRTANAWRVTSGRGGGCRRRDEGISDGN
jgi:(p)ppGpp synthase/HD superfamily hydrolase